MRLVNKFFILLVLITPNANAGIWEVGHYGCTVTDAYWASPHVPTEIGVWGNAPRTANVSIEQCANDWCDLNITLNSGEVTIENSFPEGPGNAFNLSGAAVTAVLQPSGNLILSKVSVTDDNETTAVFSLFAECFKF